MNNEDWAIGSQEGLPLFFKGRIVTVVLNMWF